MRVDDFFLYGEVQSGYFNYVVTGVFYGVYETETCRKTPCSS